MSKKKVERPLADRREWILLALDAAGGHQLTPVQLQKSLFLLVERRGAATTGATYDFRPYHYGPFDANVYQDADALVAEALVALDATSHARVRKYVLTDAGHEAAVRAAQRTPKAALAYLRAVVEWTQPLPFATLVRAIYDAYPAMRSNSIFRDLDPTRT